MANRIKISPGIDSNSLKVGNFSVGIQGAGMGPTSSTGFYNGEHIPEGGYVIYTDGPTIRVVNNDQELIDTLNKMGSSLPSDDLAGSLQWAKDNGILVIDSHFNNLVTDGLVLNLDAKHIPSYFPNIPATNILSAGDPDLNNMVTWTNSGSWVASGNATDIEPPFLNGANGAKIMRGQSNTTGSQHFGCASFAGIGGQTYTMSVWYRQSRAGASSPYFRTNINNNSLGNLSYNGDTNSANWPVNQWIRISATATLQANEGGAYLSNYLGRQKGDIVWYYAPMVQLGSTMSPFVNGTRTQNSTLIDLSGKSNNGTVNGEVAFDPTGAISFDGATNYVQVDSHPAFNVDERTIEITFKMNSSYGNYTPLAVYANGSSSTYRLWLGLQNGKFQMHGWGTTDPTATTPISVGEWYTCTFSYSNSTKEMKMYTNGKLERTMQNTQGGIPAQDGMNWYLAHMPGGEAWAGGLTHSDVTIQSFRVHDRILSDGEVAQNFYGGNIVTNNLIFATDAGNLASYVPGSNISNSLVDSISGDLLNGVGFSEENGGSWTFRSDDDGIRFAPSLNINPFSAITINGWIKVTQGGAWFRWFSGAQNTGYHFPDLAILDNGDIGYIHSSLGTPWVDTNQSIGLNNWAYVSYVFKTNGEIKIYINGKLVHTNQYSAGTFPSNFNFMLGNRYDLNGEAIVGSIASASIYSKELTQEEVLQNYNAHVARFK